MASLWKHPKSRYWVACFTDHAGRQRKRSTKVTDRKMALKLADTFEEAYRRSNTEAQARQVLNDIYQDIHGERLLTTSTKQYVADWLARKKSETAHGTYTRYREISDRFLAFLGPERAAKDLVFINPKEVVRFRDDLAAKLSGGTVNTALKILRVVFQQAWKDGYIQENPAAKVDTLKIREHREVRRPFTLKEARQLLAAAEGEWPGLILCGLYTGQRLGDIAQLKWQQVDLEHGVVDFLTSKTRRRVIIPIAKPLRRHLSSIYRKQESTSPVFPEAQKQAEHDGATRTLSNHFHDLLVKAKLAAKRTHKKAKGGRDSRRQTNQLSFHCFRHTATSLLKNAGVSEAVAMDIIGHDSKEVSANYTHIDAASKHAAFEKLPDITSG